MAHAAPRVSAHCDEEALRALQRRPLLPRAQYWLPFDGWTIDGIAEAVTTFAVIQARGDEVSLARLRELRPTLSDELRRRLLTIEFGDDRAAFEALAPEYY